MVQIKSLTTAFVSLAAASGANAYWLMGIQNFITTERIDPIVNPGGISSHVHSVLGGSNFRFDTTTKALRESECTSIPIPEDKSAYWFPHLYFYGNDGTFQSLTGGAVIYYLFNDKPGTTTAFPDDFRMISGDTSLRSYDASSFAQQAVTFLCLDFDGKTTRHNELPAQKCPSGVRAQINFPSCWDGKSTDSSNHKSHVAFPSGGPDSGTCTDPKFPVTLPRIFIEVYWDTNSGLDYSQAKNTSQPFVFANGDTTGYGYHADFINGWDAGVLQRAVDGCTCNPYGDFSCCVDKGIFSKKPDGTHCYITPALDEKTTGTLNALPGGNKVTGYGSKPAPAQDPAPPNVISPVYAYTDKAPTQSGTIVPGSAGATGAAGNSGASSSASSTATQSEVQTSVVPTSLPVVTSSRVLVGSGASSQISIATGTASSQPTQSQAQSAPVSSSAAATQASSSSVRPTQSQQSAPVSSSVAPTQASSSFSARPTQSQGAPSGGHNPPYGHGAHHHHPHHGHSGHGQQPAHGSGSGSNNSGSGAAAGDASCSTKSKAKRAAGGGPQKRYHNRRMGVSRASL